jgi:hypothetical protein
LGHFPAPPYSYRAFASAGDPISPRCHPLHPTDDTQSRTFFGLSTATYTYDAFVGAFTLLFELVFLVLRLIKRETLLTSIGGELALAATLWVFWLGKLPFLS